MANPMEMNKSRERLAATLNHKQPDGIPIDFGGTAVTGVHVSCVAALRDYYGLEKRAVRVHEPFQMLGMLDDDLKIAMGHGCGRRLFAQYHVRLFGRRNGKAGSSMDWKCWFPGDFNITVDARTATR